MAIHSWMNIRYLMLIVNLIDLAGYAVGGPGTYHRNRIDRSSPRCR
jgi:hypothetical protein